MEFDPTDRQKAILDSMNDKLVRDYQELVYDDAHAAYALVPADLSPRNVRVLLRDVTDLYMHQAWSRTPSSPRRNKPTNLSRDVLKAVTHNGEGSTYSSSCAIVELGLILHELRGITFAPVRETDYTLPGRLR